MKIGNPSIWHRMPKGVKAGNSPVWPKKKKYVSNDIVYDPNIKSPSSVDYDYEENKANKKRYSQGKKKEVYTED